MKSSAYLSRDLISGILTKTLVLVILLFPGCVPDAPRTNPVDPGSPNFSNFGGISGRILRIGSTRQGVNNALVRIKQTGAAAVSDSTGAFSFSNVPSGTLQLIVSKEQFSTDTASIPVDAGQVPYVEVYLDAVPQIGEARILTKKFDQWWPAPAYFGIISAAVSDQDGELDIDSVAAVVDTLTFGLTYSVSDKNFQVSFNADQLPTKNLQNLVGKPMTVIAVDKSGEKGTSEKFSISRIIETGATPTSPIPPDTTDGSPQFEWDPPNLTFSHTYALDIVRVDAGIQTLVWTKPNITSAPPYSLRYPNVLLSGTYFWTIAVVDDFGNICRSKESQFTVR